MSDATTQLARWAAQAGHAWPPQALDQARRAYLDTVGCIVAGSVETPARVVRASLGAWGTGGPCRLFGTAQCASAPLAALANGTAAHAQDFDDVNNPAMSHPSAVLVPALLALAGELEADGARCLDAYLVGYEILTRIGEAANLAHYFRGWHTTLSLGAPAAAVACARLMGLDAGQTRSALSMATSMGGGSKRQFGTGTKPLHAGLAAQAGVVSARLAAEGLDAAPEILEEHWGMLEMMAGDDAPGFAGVLERLGDPLAVIEHGIWIKLYPCCASTHRPIDAVLAVREESGVAAEQVESIDAMVSANAAANLRYTTPEDPSQARFSLPYCVATALIDGEVTPGSFSGPAIGRPEVQALIPRITMSVDPHLAGDGAVADTVECATVTVHTRDGASHRRRVEVPRGHPLAPLEPALLESKFRACVKGILSPGDGDLHLRALHGMGDPSRESAFADWLRAGARGQHRTTA